MPILTRSGSTVFSKMDKSEYSGPRVKIPIFYTLHAGVILHAFFVVLYWSCRLHQPSSTPIAITTVYYWGVPGELADHGNLVHKNMWSASFLIQALNHQHRCVQ